MHDVYDVVRREKVTGSLQMMFMGHGERKWWNKDSVSHLSFLTGRA